MTTGHLKHTNDRVPDPISVTELVGVGGHYLNRCDEEEHDFIVAFGVFPDALAPLRELVVTL
jgi:hypothetical protein